MEEFDMPVRRVQQVETFTRLASSIYLDEARRATRSLSPKQVKFDNQRWRCCPALRINIKLGGLT